MNTNLRLKKAATGAVAVLALGALAACGSNSSGTSAGAAPAQGSTQPAAGNQSSTHKASAPALVGPGCAAYAKQVPSGAGSVQGMAKDPVAVAASNNPLLTTLVKAVSGKLNPKVNLVDTLDNAQFTVFAPVDSAFAKLPKSAVAALAKPANAAELTKILTYHVVPGQIAPDAITGTQKTVEGGTVKVTGSGNNLKVNGAKVICGGVTTANATVYMIDSVLMPK